MARVSETKKMDALHSATAEPSVRKAIDKARAAGVKWPKILATLVSVIPAIMAKDWPAVVAAILALFQE